MRLIIGILILTWTTGCHTTARWFGSDVKEVAVVTDSKINEEDLSEFRPIIVSLELQYGIFPPNKRMYSTNYNIHCFQDGAIKACQLRLVLDQAPYLSKGIELSKRLSEKLIMIFVKERPELKQARQVFADYNCENVSSAAPPFSEKSKFCRVMNSRKINEFFIRGSAGLEISKAQSEKNSDLSKVTRSKLSCDVSDTFICEIADQNSDSTNKSILSDKTSNFVSNEFVRNYLQRWAILSGKNQVDVPILKNLTGVVQCSTLSNLTRANYICLISFE